MSKNSQKQCSPLVFSGGLAAKVFDTSRRYLDNSALEKVAGKAAAS
jgi:hypothetical protein